MPSERNTSLRPVLDHIDRQIHAWMAPRATSGIALAITDGEGPLATRSYGYADLAAGAPVTRYLPWFAVGGGHEPLTVHHLLTHTSGLPAGTDVSPDQRYRVLELVLEAVTGQELRGDGHAAHPTAVGNAEHQCRRVHRLLQRPPWCPEHGFAPVP